MATTHDDIKLLKKINSKNENVFSIFKKQGKTLTPLKGPNKNIPLKELNFNPLSFISYKYSPKTLMLMNRRKANLDENLGNTKNIINKNDNREYIYSMNTKKIKLKPLYKNRSCSQIFQKNEDIIIPSHKTTQELINYNKSNAHNTLLNYYHKNHRNLKIINFIRTNSFDGNYISNSMNKSNSLNKSLYNNNNSIHISKNEIFTDLNQKNDNINLESKKNNNIVLENKNISTINTQKENKINKKKPKNKINIDYESEIYSKKLPHNIRFFADHFFKDEKKENNKNGNISSTKKNRKESGKDFLASRNNSNLNYQIIDFKGKSRLVVTNLTNKNRKTTYRIKNNKNEDFHHIMKNPFENNSNTIEKNIEKKYNPLEHNDLANKIQNLILNPNTSKIRNNQVWLNNKLNYENKNISFKEIRALSQQGFEKMEADKYRRFNLLVKKTNKDVIQLEKKLDELLEENKKIFLDEKSDINL